MPLSILSGPESSFLLAWVKAGGVAATTFIMFFVIIKIWVRMQKQESDRINTIIQMTDARWIQKFDQDKEERGRQYDLFKGLLENVSAHTGELAGINAKLDNQSRDIDGINHNLGVLHGRIDLALNGHRELNLSALNKKANV